jgi:trk system potassium uptake protein TrkA
MADRKRFVVLGLGSFGTALATQLSENGCRVTGVDQDTERVEELKRVLHEAIIGDSTELELLQHLDLASAQAVFISLGESIEPSLLTTLHAKECGAKRIIVKGVTTDHGKILQRLGVERVIFPEIEVAKELADRMTWPNVLDYLPIDDEHSMLELAVPDSLAGQTLREADLRRRFGVSVVGLKDALTGKLAVFPEPELRLSGDQLLLVVGRQEGVNRLRELK